MSRNHDLSGRVIAITGGGRGIGLATAQALVAAGARVALGDIDEASATAAAQGLGDAAVATHVDVSDSASVNAFVEFAERELGPLDVLVNNAGIMPIGAFLDEDDSLATRAIDINVLGPLYGTKAALRLMLPRGRGHVVNVASIAGRSPVPGGITYAASKAAIVSLTESARVEFAKSGVTFSCVMPSFTATELIAGTKGTRFVKTVQPADVAEAIVEGIATQRPDIFVPRSLGVIAKTQPLMGRRLRDALNRALGADRTFLDIDHSARASYDRRIAAPADTPQLGPAPTLTEAHATADTVAEPRR